MIKYKDYLVEYYLHEDNMDEELKNAYSLVTFLVLSERSYMYNFENSEELVNEGLNDILGKVGLSLHKHNPGVLGYLKLFTTGVGKIVYAAVKGDKEEVKKIAKSLNKEDVIDFLLKLDLLTLHSVTGPIHMVDALTGWDLSAAIKKSVNAGSEQLKNIKNVIGELKALVKKTFEKDIQKLAYSKVKEIEQIIPSKL